jgi:hypothetical protein
MFVEFRKYDVHPINIYIALSMFLSTKTIHLDLVADLTASAILALKRFMDRRWKMHAHT